MEMVETLQSRVTAGARSYRMATVRYLMRPPLSLRPKYAAFLLDLAAQSDHVQEVLGRAAERATEGDIAALLRHHYKEERTRMQMVMADLRRLGYADQLPDREMTTGDAALRAYGTNLSYERPTAMLGMLLVFWGWRPRLRRPSCACSASAASRASRCAGCSCGPKRIPRR